MRTIGVFCGSSSGSDAKFIRAAEAVGELIAGCGKSLVYGGYRYGVMGALAGAALANGGQVIGVIPQGMFGADAIHPQLTEVCLTVDLSARKAKMASLADAFISLPGGIGTLDELLEMWVLCQLKVHSKPNGILNLDGYYDQLLAFLDEAVRCQFLASQIRRLLIEAPEPELLLQRLQAASDAMMDE